MSEPQNGDQLGRRLRANRGRLLRPGFRASIERAIGSRVAEGDFLDLATSDHLAKEVRTRLRHRRDRSWPESQEDTAAEHLLGVGRNIDASHSSFLMFFESWDELGALRVNSSGVLAHFRSLWQKDREPLCLITTDLHDGLYFDHTDVEQLDDEDSFELWAWGVFATPHADDGDGGTLSCASVPV